jgi:hypothetical protein
LVSSPPGVNGKPRKTDCTDFTLEVIIAKIALAEGLIRGGADIALYVCATCVMLTALIPQVNGVVK